MRHRYGTAWSAMLAVLLSGCGGGADPSVPGLGGGSSNDVPVTLKSFSISGSAMPVGGEGRVPIDPYVNGGAFQVSWQTQGQGPYRVDLYVSTDTILETSTDKKFFGQNCDEGSPIMKCGISGRFDCRYTTENKIGCGTHPEASLSNFLTALPRSAYIIMRMCDAVLWLQGDDKCEIRAQAVLFR